MALWGGRFQGASDPLFRELNDSLRFDWRLVRHDVEGSIAWAGALRVAGVLSQQERDQIVVALQEISALAAEWPRTAPETGDEDVHSWVETRLVERVGALGKKLHTGRSRNDQVATDLRLYVREQLGLRLQDLHAAQCALVELAERDVETPLPGYTHLQRAQPTLLAHWCLAYVEMLSRDASRLRSALDRSDECPLGAGALAGTAFPIDRHALAKSLGFARPTANSLDAVSDRDFVVETLAAAALCAVHLSRFAEDLIIYSSAEFGFVELSDAVTSGSSLMPQKKNPDALELLRGKAGRILGAHVALCTTIKGLPLAYNKDLQEDKEPLFDALDNLSMCLRIVPAALTDIKVNRDACLAAATGGYANATELADYLVDRGVPFRDAHDTVGLVVRHALTQRKKLEELPLEELRRFSPHVENDVYDRLSLQSTLARRDVFGATAPTRVAAAVAEAKQRLQREHTGFFS